MFAAFTSFSMSWSSDHTALASARFKTRAFFKFMVDGELVWKTFPPTADGWRAVLELARGDAYFKHDIRSIESAKACGFSGWLLQLLIEEGLTPQLL